MPKICYTAKRFQSASLSVIQKANEILEDYARQGYDLTLRQLYYQFVSRDLIPNTQKDYKRLGDIVSDARMAGLIDWTHITDRTRNVRENSHWANAESIISICSDSFAMDKWLDQEYYVEVWVEKDALVGVLDVACRPLDIPFFSCRGYTSQSEMWNAAMRILRKLRAHKKIRILHLGDHDPSGIDMSRDVKDRMRTFLGYHHPNPDFSVKRIALTMDQINEYNPPPNPAKMDDPRASDYVQVYGDTSWELDALEPAVISDLIRNEVISIRKEWEWEAAVAREESEKGMLRKVAEHWDSVESYVQDLS